MMSRKLKKPSSIKRDSSNDEPALALEGLEQAKILAGSNNKEALRLYELSIELLLKSLKATNDAGTRNMLTQQITMALSEAEKIKARIPNQQHHQPSFQSTKEGPSSSPLSNWSSLSNSLSAAIYGSPSAQEKSSATRKKNSKKSTSRPSTKSVPPATATHKTASRQHYQSEQRPATTVRPTKQSSPPSTVNNNNTTRQHRRLLDYKNDPLVQQVKSDLYVDPSELAKITWDDIAGLERAKQSLQESAILPLLRPDLFSGLRKAQNILLYGPPGTGKTMLVKAVAHESSCLLFACSASTLTSKWHGEGEKLVRTMFRVAQDAAPSLIFVDEMDSLLSTRSDSEHEASRRFKTEFMVQMDGVSPSSGNVLVVGATNCPWSIDDAVLRRFPRRISIPLPDKDARKALLKNLLKKAGKHDLTSRQQSSLVSKLEGYSCSDISSIASEASFGPLRGNNLKVIQNIQESQLRPIGVQDFDTAIQQSTKSVSQSLLKRYKEWERDQGVAG